jgi:hypothetical protein
LSQRYLLWQPRCSSWFGDSAAFDCQTYSIFEPVIKCVIVRVAAGQTSILPSVDQQLIITGKIWPKA